jgi:hypothetical protein
MVRTFTVLKRAEQINEKYFAKIVEKQIDEVSDW